MLNKQLHSIARQGDPVINLMWDNSKKTRRQFTDKIALDELHTIMED